MYAEAVSEDSVVADLGEVRGVYLETGSMCAVLIAEFGKAAELVYGHEMLDAVGYLAGHVSGVVRVGFGGVAALPAALVFKCLWKVPVEEGAVRLDACAEELVDEAIVVVQAGLVRRACAGREDARPGYGEAAGLQAEGLHGGDVLLIAVIAVVGDVAGVAVRGLAGGVREGVPDGLATAAFVDCAFDLVGGGCRSPEEACGEGSCGALSGGGRG